MKKRNLHPNKVMSSSMVETRIAQSCKIVAIKKGELLPKSNLKLSYAYQSQGFRSEDQKTVSSIELVP